MASTPLVSWLMSLMMILLSLFGVTGTSSSATQLPQDQKIENAQVELVPTPVATESPTLDVDGAWSLISQAQNAYYAGDSDQAIALMRQAASECPDPDVMNVCAYSLYSIGDLEGAVEIFNSLVELDPVEYHLVRYDIAGALFNMGDRDTARVVMDTALALYPDDPENITQYVNTAYVHMGQEEALMAADNLLLEHPEIADLHVLRAWTLAEDFAYDDAYTAIRQAVTLAKESNDSLTWYYWQQYYLEKQMGEFSQALKTLSRAISPMDDLSLWLERVSLKLWSLLDAEAALEDLDALILKHGNDTDLLYYRMFANLRLENYDAARADVAAMTADATTIQLMEGICALNENDSALALEKLDAVLAATPEHLPAQLYRAIVSLSLLDEPDVALTFVNQALALDPMNADANRLQGFCYERLGQWTLAEASYAQAVASANEDSMPGAYLVSLLLDWNRADEALTVLEQLEKQYPNWSDTLIARYSYAFAQLDYAGALDAVKLHQARFPAVADDMERMEAVLYAHLGEHDKAIALFESYLEEPDAGIYNDYAYVLAVLGEYDQAQAALDAAWVLMETSTDAPGIQKSNKIYLLTTGAELAWLQGDEEGCMKLLDAACELGLLPASLYTYPVFKESMDTATFQDLLTRYPVE